MSVNYHIRKGKKSDIPAVFDLIKELAIYEKAEEKVSNSVEKMYKEGFGENPAFFFLVAETVDTHEVIGTAVYYISYSTWKGKSLYLDDLIVREAYRRFGVGSALMNALLEEKKAHQAALLHWQVLDWNTPAIRFYKKFKATFDEEWINCKVLL